MFAPDAAQVVRRRADIGTYNYEARNPETVRLTSTPPSRAHFLQTSVVELELLLDSTAVDLPSVPPIDKTG